jgi:hypothetical protein
MEAELKRINWISDRELPITVQGRSVMVKATASGLTFWKKGSQEKFFRSWEDLTARIFGPGFVLPASARKQQDKAQKRGLA